MIRWSLRPSCWRAKRRAFPRGLIKRLGEWPTSISWRILAMQKIPEAMMGSVKWGKISRVAVASNPWKTRKQWLIPLSPASNTLLHTTIEAAYAGIGVCVQASLRNWLDIRPCHSAWILTKDALVVNLNIIKIVSPYLCVINSITQSDCEESTISRLSKYEFDINSPAVP